MISPEWLDRMCRIHAAILNSDWSFAVKVPACDLIFGIMDAAYSQTISDMFTQAGLVRVA